jgi:hypothetical protein
MTQLNLLKNGKKSKISAAYLGVASGSVQNDTLEPNP